MMQITSPPTAFNLAFVADLGDFYLSLKQYDQALEQYSLVKAKKPEIPQGYLKSAVVLSQMGMLDKAITVLEFAQKAKQLNPDSHLVMDTHTFLQDEKNQIKDQLAKADQKIAVFKEIKEELVEELNNASINHESILLQRRQRLEAMKMELVDLKTKYSDIYPDVKKLELQIQDLKKIIANEKEENNHEDELKNPLYISLSARLAGIKSDIGSVNNQIEDLNEQADTYRARLAAIPGVEEQYKTLLMERDNLNAKYNELQAKMMEAKIARKPEFEQKGERFTLIEAALFPEKPYKPNRIAIGLIGVVLGLGAGVGLASLMEFSDGSCRSADALSKASGFPVLTVVPDIITPRERKKRLIVRILIIFLAVGLLAGGVILFHFYVMDLTLLWLKINKKIG